jgi:hypothetical protein
MFEDSAPSMQIRTAYVAHLISTILLDRVFTPFLFGLGQRSEGTEALLEDVSGHLRAKSSRKEATWRQHTLLAAYTTTDAKLRMNKEAGRVMDDIVAAVVSCTTESEAKADEIRGSVRKIVKLAVETWRYARLEREMIEAFMPAAGVEASPDGERGLWLPYDIEGSLDPGADKIQKANKKMLLRLFPVIRRESVQEGFRFTKKDCNDNGCIYSKGWALYRD